MRSKWEEQCELARAEVSQARRWSTEEVHKIEAQLKEVHNQLWHTAVEGIHSELESLSARLAQVCEDLETKLSFRRALVPFSVYRGIVDVREHAKYLLGAISEMRCTLTERSGF